MVGRISLADDTLKVKQARQEPLLKQFHFMPRFGRRHNPLLAIFSLSKGYIWREMKNGDPRTSVKCLVFRVLYQNKYNSVRDFSWGRTKCVLIYLNNEITKVNHFRNQFPFHSKTTIVGCCNSYYENAVLNLKTFWLMYSNPHYFFNLEIHRFWSFQTFGIM